MVDLNLLADIFLLLGGVVTLWLLIRLLFPR